MPPSSLGGGGGGGGKKKFTGVGCGAGKKAPPNVEKRSPSAAGGGGGAGKKALPNIEKRSQSAAGRGGGAGKKALPNNEKRSQSTAGGLEGKIQSATGDYSNVEDEDMFCVGMSSADTAERRSYRKGAHNQLERMCPTGLRYAWGLWGTVYENVVVWDPRAAALVRSLSPKQFVASDVFSLVVRSMGVDAHVSIWQRQLFWDQTSMKQLRKRAAAPVDNYDWFILPQNYFSKNMFMFYWQSHKYSFLLVSILNDSHYLNVLLISDIFQGTLKIDFYIINSFAVCNAMTHEHCVELAKRFAMVAVARGIVPEGSVVKIDIHMVVMEQQLTGENSCCFIAARVPIFVAKNFMRILRGAVVTNQNWLDWLTQELSFSHFDSIHARDMLSYHIGGGLVGAVMMAICCTVFRHSFVGLWSHEVIFQLFS